MKVLFIFNLVITYHIEYEGLSEEKYEYLTYSEESKDILRVCTECRENTNARENINSGLIDSIKNMITDQTRRIDARLDEHTKIQSSQLDAKLDQHTKIIEAKFETKLHDINSMLHSKCDVSAVKIMVSDLEVRQSSKIQTIAQTLSCLYIHCVQEQVVLCS